jgi:hypothetical protein
MATASKVKTRRLCIRLALIALLAGLGVLMYNIGREYGILLDNGKTTIGGEEYRAIPYGLLVIDGDEKNPLEFWEDDRLLHKLTGKTHTFTVKILDEDDESVIGTVQRVVTLDFDTRRWMLSLPAMAIAGRVDEILVANPAYTGDPEIVPGGDDAVVDEESVQF